MFGLKFV